MNPVRQLDQAAVLSAALAAHAEAASDERLTGPVFGTFKAGGCYWSLHLSRRVGNTTDSGVAVRPGAREMENRAIIEAWQDAFFSPPAEGSA